MRTITTTTEVFLFEELTGEQQKTAIDNNYDINIDYEWWEYTYEDANDIGLKITAFDIGRSWSIDGGLTLDPVDVATKIKADHGEQCNTYMLAGQYLLDVGALPVDEYGDPDGDAEEALTAEFERALLEEYLHILNKEYEYLTSDEAIQEALISNEYEFTADGNII